MSEETKKRLLELIKEYRLERAEEARRRWR